MRSLVLASTSRYRRKLLDDLNVPFEALAPEFDEDHALERSPEALAIAFARGKAESLARHRPEALILGADQVPELDGRVLTKPGSRDAAVEQLLALAGRTHRLLTAIALFDPGRGTTEHRLVVHAMRMRPLTRAAAVAYVERDDPIDCAGAYKVEAAGVLLFERMDGPDHTGIVGLPLTSVVELLAAAGVDLLALVTGRGSGGPSGGADGGGASRGSG